MGQYLPIVALLVLVAAFAGISLIAQRILVPPRPNAAKAAPYECGILDTSEPPERFPVRFYLVAMIFVVVDIEIIFLYPYVIVHRELGAFGMIEILVFAIAVFASFVYLIANGALDWGPSQHLARRGSEATSATRTTTSTVRRVGQEGRRPASEAAA